MSEWLYPLSKKIARRTVSVALSAALLAVPVMASAASTPSCYCENELTKEDFQLSVGESRSLNNKLIEKLWGGIDPKFSPEKAVRSVEAALPQSEYEALFPYRIGSKGWHEFNKKGKNYDKTQIDYYSYQNLIDAVTQIAGIKYKVSYRKGVQSAQQIFRLDKKTKVETLIVQTADFDKPEHKDKSIESQIVDYGSFLNEGSAVDRKRNLAALLANLAHETGGGWAEAPGGPLRWGLYWNENIAGKSGTNPSTFVDPATASEYPGTAGKKYYGRGPIMLSWNFNYGLMSAILYGDKHVLLQNPELLIVHGKLGFATALLFWMTPQAPKPSAHDVMINRWVPTEDQIDKGLSPAGFGVSIMVLNGLEANLDEKDGTVGRRVGTYLDITKRMGVDVEGEKLNTLGMKPF